MYKPKLSKNSYKSRKKQVRTKKDIICSQIKPGMSSAPFEEYHHAQGLFEDQNDVEGKEVFQVRTTPKANRKSFLEKFDRNLSLSANSPKSKKEEHKKPQSDTPTTSEKTERQTRSLRLKMKQELAGLKSASIDSDPEDSDNASDDEDYESDSQSEEEMLSAAICDTSKGKKNKGPSFSEVYFTAQKQKKSTTSNKTLANVKLEQTNIPELMDIFENIPDSHKKEKNVLFKKHCCQFQYWNSLLEAGFNILLYGVGSKIKLLKEFCKKHLENSLYVVIYGFFPSLTLKQMLYTITEDALGHEGRFSNVQDHCDFIKNYFLECDEELYIIIHNIDGTALRSVKTQSILSSLATIPYIHFICSIDHINAPLLWDQIMMSHFKWVWFDTTTFEPYVLETSYENSLLRDQSSHLLLSSLLHVYNSLTPNSRGIFLILAKHQKEENKTSNAGITFHEWYQECREAFLVNSEITMQAQLSEFKNHKLLTSRKNCDGIELWYIPVDTATLDQFLESCE